MKSLTGYKDLLESLYHYDSRRFLTASSASFRGLNITDTGAAGKNITVSVFTKRLMRVVYAFYCEGIGDGV